MSVNNEYTITTLSNAPRLRGTKARPGFYNLPTSPVADMIMQILGTDGDTRKLEKGAALSKGKTKITFEDDPSDNATLINVQSKTYNTFVEVDDIDKLAGNRKGVKKMLLYSFISINEQAYSVDHSTGEGVLRQNFITFPVQALVDAGLYNDKSNARRGFGTSVRALTSMKACGSIVEQKGKKRTVTSSALEVLFPGAKIEKGQCTIYLNERVNWGFVTKFYTIIPTYCFSLDVKPFDLLYYIFFLARQNIDNIKERGYFTISMRAIQYRLGLPSEIGNKKTKETIKDVIEAAICSLEDKIAEESAETGKPGEFKITPVYNEKASIKDYLDNGYLKVELLGNYAKCFLSLADNKKKLRDAAAKRKQKVEDTAKAKALQKTIEAEIQKE